MSTETFEQTDVDTGTARTHRLGRLGIRVEGTDPIRDYLLAELEPLRAAVDDAHLSIRFGAEIPRPVDGVVLSPVVVGRDGYIARHGGLEYHVSGSAPRLSVRVRSLKSFSTERLTPGWLMRAGSRNHLLPSEGVAKNFMYNVFDHLTQLANLELGQSYLHASSFERDGRGVAIAAWGGVGKTTSMLKLVTERDWRFLSDDLGLVDDEGTLWRTPKRLQVYAYNVEGQPALYRTLMSGRSTLDRAAWHLRRMSLGVDRVRRRVSAEELFGAERVGSRARLVDLFAMERADVEAIEMTPIDVDEVVRRATATIMREVHPLGDLISAVQSGPHRGVLPTHQEFLERTAGVLARAFRGLSARLIRVPLRSDPDRLADFLVRALDAD